MRAATRTSVDLDQGFLPGRSPREPRLAKDLLRALGVDRRTRDVQRRAVQQWLSSHRANRLLRDDLEEAGLLG
jgi:hypothetical protein